MRKHRLKSSAGFTLIAAMAMIVILGIMAGAAAQSWQMLMKREREEELLFRGQQYMSALTKWYNGGVNYKTPPGNQPAPALQPTNNRVIKDFKDLEGKKVSFHTPGAGPSSSWRMK